MAWFDANDGVRLWYEDQGEGAAILFLHGWCMSSAVWQLQTRFFSPSYRVIVPDLRGHGRSGHGGGDCNLARFSDDIAALIRHLNLENLFLAGWSQGAQVALEIARLLRERLTGLALVAGTPCFTASEDFPFALPRIEADGMALKVRRNTARALDGFIDRMFATGERDDPPRDEQARRILASVPIPETNVALESLQSLVDTDQRGMLSAIDLPTLIINGDADRICLPEASAYLARHIPASRQVIMPKTGHAPFLSHPAEFNHHLKRFLVEAA
jgi:pimeloyl-[acyl-carrier protein] methyl ester esterase